MKHVFVISLVTFIIISGCQNEHFPTGIIDGTWSWIESQGGLLPTRNLENSSFRQTVEIENNHYKDIRSDTVAFEWDFDLQITDDGFVLKSPTISHASRLVKFISTDTVTIQTFIGNGHCSDCGFSTYVRIEGQD